jgi:hypothetical protein
VDARTTELKTMKKEELDKLTDDELMQLRIKDVHIPLEETDLYPLVQEVFSELRAKGLDYQPRIYFGDEWFSPEGFNAVALPFFLAHPRLRQLERKLMKECEGEPPFDFKKFFRHELGHAFDHAYKVSQRKLWQKTFGSNKKPYTPESYRPRPYSRNFVKNISETYAQAHPHEDFAETFAVWLDPTSNWKETYHGWGAFKKIQYMDRLALEFQNRFVPSPRGRMLSEAKYLNSSLDRYYYRKRKQFEDDYPDFHDDDLLKIFGETSHIPRRYAYQFMRSYRRKLVDITSSWTDERKFHINQFLTRLIDRCKERKFVLIKDETQTAMELSAFLATLVANYKQTGRFRRDAA